MKRLWPYLGALFPVEMIDAEIAEVLGETRSEDDLPRHRSKKSHDASEDEQADEQSDEANDGHKPHASRGHEVTENDAQPQNGYDDPAAGHRGGSGTTLPSADDSNSPGSHDTQADMYSSMYGPSGVADQIGMNGLGGGGFVFLGQGQAFTSGHNGFFEDNGHRHGSSQPLPARESAELPGGTDATGPTETASNPTPAPLGGEPLGSEPLGSELTGAEPAGSEPTGSEPAGSEPSGGEIAGAEPAGGEADVTDADSMIVMLGGTAVAQGADGTTNGTIDLDIVDYGAVTIAKGIATFEALSSGSGAEPAMVDTFFDVIGADMVFSYNVDYDYALPFGQFVSFSQTYVFAIDFEDGAGAQAADVANSASPFAEVTGLFAGLPPELLAMFDTEGSEAFSIDGNISDLTFELVSNGSGPASLVASTVSVETTSSIADLDAQWDSGSIAASVDADGAATIASIGATAIFGVENEYSTLSGWVIGAA